MISYWDTLPDEISMSVFCMFPYRSQYIMSVVCKRWYTLIRTMGRVNETRAAQLTTLYTDAESAIDLRMERVFTELAAVDYRFTFMSDPVICRLIQEECYELMDRL